MKGNADFVDPSQFFFLGGPSVPAAHGPPSYAQKALAEIKPDSGSSETLEQQRAKTDQWQAEMGKKSLKRYPVDLTTDAIAGVPVRVATPSTVAAEKSSRVLINLHGGGFQVDSGSLSESIPIANLTGTRVIPVLYRLSPEHRFPAAVDDVVAVYKELLKDHKPGDLGLYGTSAGAVLTAEVAVEVRRAASRLSSCTGSRRLEPPHASHYLFTTVWSLRHGRQERDENDA